MKTLLATVAIFVIPASFAHAEDPLYCPSWLEFLQSGLNETSLGQSKAQKKTAGSIVKLGLEKSLHRFVHISKFTNRTVWFVSLLLESSEALTGSLGDPYRGSPEKLAKFFELEKARQEKILSIDDAFARYLKKILISIQSELPKPMAFKQSDTVWNGQMRDNDRYLSTLEVKLEGGQLEEIQLRDEDSKLVTKYFFEDEEVKTVEVRRQTGVAYEGRFQEFEMEADEYERQVHSNSWGYPAVRKAEKRNWMALQGFLFHLDGVKGDCQRTLASKKKPRH